MPDFAELLGKAMMRHRHTAADIEELWAVSETTRWCNTQDARACLSAINDAGYEIVPKAKGQYGIWRNER